MIEKASYPLSFVEKILLVILRPKLFFDVIEKEKSVSDPIKFYLILSVVLFPALVLINLYNGVSDAMEAFLSLVLLFFSGLILAAFNFLVVHLATYLLGGRNGASKTLQVYFYGLTPMAILSWYPILNIVGVIYSAVLIVYGLNRLQGLSTLRAVIAYLFPALVSLLFIIGVFLMGMANISPI